jgi:hypothetical protein
MSDINFVDKVKKYFVFLEKEYGFRLTKEDNSDFLPKTDGVVEYTSNSTVIVIDSETGYASVWFYRSSDDRKYNLDPVVIHEYLNTNATEKELLLSTNPQDSSYASALFNQKFLLNQPEWKAEDGTTEERLELRLENYAEWIKKYANQCINGDFSKWPKFYEYKILRARADSLRRGEDEQVYIRVKDIDGKSKLIKQSAFKDEFQHIEKLKKEFSDPSKNS